MQIFNTMTRKKEDFIPQEPGVYRIYVCGPTVYNYIHIGNARPMIVFDTLRRYLEYLGNKVLYVSNITDSITINHNITSWDSTFKKETLVL